VQRKLRLSRTMSLAARDPLAFERFRETGVLHFATPTSLFDRDFPGHYLRLVTGVRASVVIVDPPVTGIRATLATTGTSYVTVVSGDGFARVAVQRGPETMVLTGPSPSGRLETEPRSELLVPFENIGVDTTWRFAMPRPANPIDYAGIADVLVTIDYTALASDDLRQWVIQGLDPAVRTERPFSLRYDLPDQWHDLHHPDQSATPLTVQFHTDTAGFRADLTDLVLRHVTLAFTPRYAGGAGEPPAAWDTAMVADLSFTPDGGAPALGGTASPTGGVITTRPGPGNAPGWQALTAGGPAPVGTWSLRLTNPARAVLDSGDLDDILLILSYDGTTRPWPEEG
jgi:Tc toxin complex TcA C-terminal TcB-binding domain